MLEAMARGTPVLAARATALLADPVHRADLAERGRTRVAQFS